MPACWFFVLFFFFLHPHWQTPLQCLASRLPDEDESAQFGSWVTRTPPKTLLHLLADFCPAPKRDRQKWKVLHTNPLTIRSLVALFLFLTFNVLSVCIKKKIVKNSQGENYSLNRQIKTKPHLTPVTIQLAHLWIWISSSLFWKHQCLCMEEPQTRCDQCCGRCCLQNTVKLASLDTGCCRDNPSTNTWTIECHNPTSQYYFSGYCRLPWLSGDWRDMLRAAWYNVRGPSA